MFSPASDVLIFMYVCILSYFILAWEHQNYSSYVLPSVNSCINRCFTDKSIQTFHLHLFMLYRLLGSMKMILDMFYH